MVIYLTMRFVLIIGFILTLSVSGVYAQDADVQVELLEEDIVGLALYPDGETPVVDMPVRVWSVDKKEMIFRSRTDENGNFRIPTLEAGKNYLFVGRVRVNLKIFKGDVNDSHQYHDIVMVVSRGMVVPAKPNIMEILMAPVIMRPPEDPPVISP